MKKILSLLFLLGFINSAFADEEFYGKIESMPADSFEGEWVIDGKSYQVTSDTEIDEEDGNAKVGACVGVLIISTKHKHHMSLFKLILIRRSIF